MPHRPHRDAVRLRIRCAARLSFALALGALGCGEGSSGDAAAVGDAGGALDAGGDTSSDVVVADVSADAGPEADAGSACGVAGATCSADGACCSRSCLGGACQAVHLVALDADRDRLLETLATVRGVHDRCALWTSLDDVQRGLWLTHSDMLGNRSCMATSAITSGDVGAGGACTGACRCAPGADMALAHVFELRAIDGSDPTCSCTEGDTGYSCCNGGGDWHRTFFTADDALIAALRDVASALPEWGPSTDLAGPHAPFTQSSETVQGSPRGQTHFFARDADATPLARNGVEGLLEPHVVELDNDYNLLHDSNPEGCYGLFGLFCKYGRVEFKGSWGALGNQAPTTFRGNGEPSAIAELAGDAVYAPTCPTSRIDAVTPASAPPGASLTLHGTGFLGCSAQAACGNVVHLRTRAGEHVLDAASGALVAEAPTEITLRLPAGLGAGGAYAWVEVGAVISNLVNVTIGP